jgi:hypothetical protein
VEPVIVYLCLALIISWLTIREDRLQKKIAKGFKPNAKDGDKDGLIQEGTKFERKAKGKK